MVQEWVDLPVPLDMQVGMFADQILLKLRSDWSIGELNLVVFAALTLLSFTVCGPELMKSASLRQSL